MSTTPHDALFRAIFSDPQSAASELQHCLPADVTACIDFSTLKLRPGTFVDDDLQNRHTDLLFDAKMSGRDAFVYVLFVHQSRPDKWMMLRMAGYMVRIWEDFLTKSPAAEKLPVIIPVVLSQVDGGWQAAWRFADIVDIAPNQSAVFTRYVPNFEVEIEDLARIAEDELERRDMVAKAKLALLLLRHTRRAENILELLRRWASNIPEAFGEELSLVFVWYILYVHPKIDVDGLRAFARNSAPKWEASIMTAAERLIQEGKQQGRQEGLRTGRQQGRQEGRQEGLLSGRRSLLLRLIESRFGALPADFMVRVDEADAAQLDQWADRILNADSLAALFGTAPKTEH